MNFKFVEPNELPDHEFLAQLHNDPLVLRNITNPEKITLESHLSWWNSLNFERERRFIFKVDDQNAGFVKFYQIDKINKNCVLGADLHIDFRGKGLSKHMWTMMLEYCFQNLQMHRVSLTTASFNLIAQNVYKGLGFKEEGRKIQSMLRDESFNDEICMYMLKEMWKP